MSKTFTYTENGLSYTVTVFENDDGMIQATITMTEGSMDVNALYWGDDDFSGASANLGGPLNMNGEGSQYEGERVQWDGAEELSRPGLGREGEDKETFLGEGDSLTIDLEDVHSLDEIDFIGIRATSVNGDGSIKGVSGDPEVEDPEEPEEPEDPDEPEDPEEPEEPATYGKVWFAEFNEDGEPAGGFQINAIEPDPNEFDVPFLEEGTEPTFENYLNRYLELSGNNGDSEHQPDVSDLAIIVFFDTNEDGSVGEELFRIEAPEGGFEDRDAVLDAYAEQVQHLDSEAEYFVAMGVDSLPDEDAAEELDSDDDDLVAA